MVDCPFPMLTAPGQKQWVAGGRLVNCYPEPNAKTAGKPNSYWRVPGVSVFGTAPTGLYRGGIQVGSTFFAGAVALICLVLHPPTVVVIVLVFLVGIFSMPQTLVSGFVGIY